MRLARPADTKAAPMMGERMYLVDAATGTKHRMSRDTLIQRLRALRHIKRLDLLVERDCELAATAMSNTSEGGKDE